MANQLRDMGVRYRGTPVTKTMILSVGNVHELFDESSLDTLCKIDREFGRDVLSNSDSKLRSFMSVLKAHAMSVAGPGKIKEVPPLSKTAHFGSPERVTVQFECFKWCLAAEYAQQYYGEHFE